MQRWWRSLGIGLCMMVLLLGSACQPRLQWGDEQKLLSQVWTLVDRAYVDETFNDQNWWAVRDHYLRETLPDREATYAAISTMLASLGDPFTRFLDPEHYRSLQTSTAGELVGVGLQIAIDEAQQVRVIAPVEASPADRAGVKAGDRIQAIDDELVAGLNLDEVADRLRGAVGSLVRLTLQRGEAAPFDIVIERDVVAIHPVRTQRLRRGGKTYAYIRLNQFNANASQEMAVVIQQAEADQVAGYVLDLRGNPGGLLQAGIDIARQWLNEGEIVHTLDRNGIQETATANGTALTVSPLVVLVDQGTASASEVLAGALQDNHRARLVGTQTFGKGVIQSLFSLGDGSGVAVTVAKYATPSGRDINKLGIAPDVVVTLEEPLDREDIATDRDRQLQAALDSLAGRGELAWDAMLNLPLF